MARALLSAARRLAFFSSAAWRAAAWAWRLAADLARASAPAALSAVSAASDRPSSARRASAWVMKLSNQARKSLSVVGTKSDLAMVMLLKLRADTWMGGMGSGPGHDRFADNLIDGR